jgi:hypothetical protein
VANPHPPLGNLKPWQPGQSGNPAGSSRRQRLTTKIHRKLDRAGQEETFARVGLARALKGDYRFWSFIFDKLDGRPVEEGEAILEEVLAEHQAEGEGDAVTPP